jgi:hypothetical protein
MIELRRNLLPPATAAIIDELADETALEGFCLVGGTALALQAGHRRSLDVDLVTFATKLDKNGLFRAMRARGATLVTPQSMISTGEDQRHRPARPRTELRAQRNQGTVFCRFRRAAPCPRYPGGEGLAFSQSLAQ